MKFSGNYLYRVRVNRYPDGSHEPVDPEGEIWMPVPGWRPPGWRPAGNYAQILGTTEFVWPVTSHVYGSRKTAKKRADLLESFGAEVTIECAPIRWSDT